MYYLAREHGYLVVERAPSSHQPHPYTTSNTQAVIEINSDSDIEVINQSSTKLPATLKRSNSEAFSPGDTGDLKRIRLPTTEFTSAHPAFLPAGVRPIAPEANSTAAPLSASIMNWFQVTSHTLLQSVEEQLPGRRHTTTPSFPGVENTGRMSGLEVAVLVRELQDVGRQALTQLDGLLRIAKNSKAFVASSTEPSMDLFKERCYKIVGIIEEAGVLAPRVQVQ
ncbi:hypothetical protein PTTG_30155 [Puccinia triticina 1-1 BBBD Race 1]|uniref:Uncharacterized protein n=1 Tax=Puccinia triticina (isolate 1-1 / race 1 (BBBD)) TaxID=630390 RepID=A0A180G2A5_PUCT1|nr:hypothetical protein PTTG_30155 [Puccinia triticina 1-1 BBBD Race 1]